MLVHTEMYSPKKERWRERERERERVRGKMDLIYDAISVSSVELKFINMTN